MERRGVGGRPLMWYSQDGGAFSNASDEELEVTQNDVGGWVLIEKESLDKGFPEMPVRCHRRVRRHG